MQIYGGGFLAFLEGDLEVPASSIYEKELEQENELGGYLGLLVDLGSGAAANLEYQFMSDGWLLAVGIGVAF